MTTNNGVSPCSKKMYRKFSGCLALAFTLTASPLWAVSSDLMNLGIEDLMNIEVTSVSGKGQNLSDSAAAIFVITQDDLKRSGVTNIPDALRMVPEGGRLGSVLRPVAKPRVQNTAVLSY